MNLEGCTILSQIAHGSGNLVSARVTKNFIGSLFPALPVTGKMNTDCLEMPGRSLVRLGIPNTRAKLTSYVLLSYV